MSRVVDHFAEQIVPWCRHQFPALARIVNGHPAAFFDGPAGTQVPQSVIEAISDYLANRNANHGGCFATSRESDAMLHEAHAAMADFLGANDPGTVCFGANMTTLTFAFSRALARTWRPGDEIVVTRTEHDANFTPWVMAAEDAGVTVRYADVNRQDTTLNVDDLRSKLSDQTRLVALGCASNATGTINPVRDVCRWAREVGALSFVDAVHFAPHAAIDVEHLGCDFLVCSAYKFFGPHIGILWGQREHLESLTPYKVRPADDSTPDRWMTGTQNHECIAGVLAAVEYLAALGRRAGDDESLGRRAALESSFASIREYEMDLLGRLLDGLEQIPGVRVWGITDRQRFAERLPTISITHQSASPQKLANYLGEKGFFVWDGNYYALPLTTALGVEPDGMVRIGIVHYNNAAEIDRLVAAIRAIG